MKGGSTGWSARSGLGSMSAPQRPQMSDYGVMTMKLRGKVSKGKPKTSRYYRNMRSVSSFQNRNLDNYPMPHGREDAIRSASSHRQERRLNQENMTRTRLDSETMKDYSKQMFDSVVKHVTKNGPSTYKNQTGRKLSKTFSTGPRNTLSSRLSHRDDVYSPCSDYPKNNGPSREGSILYNSKQQLLNAIRLRPHSEPVDVFNHEKNKTRPGLKEAINEKNINYTVRPNRSSLYSRAGSVTCSTITRSSCSSADYVLIPLNDKYKDIERHFSLDLSFSDLNDSLETERDTFDEDTDLNSVFKPAVYRRESYLLPPSASHGLRLVSLDEDDSSGSEDEVETKVPQPTTEVKKPDPAPPHRTLDKTTRARGQKVPEPEQEAKPVYVKIKLKGPHCWVDDATVTSDTSDQGLPDVVDVNHINQSDSKKPEVGKPPLLKRLSQTDMQKAKRTDFVETDKRDENLERIEDDNICNEEVTIKHLPPFLCPSSENKSKEAAIKDWLAHTCFRSADRSVPML